MTERAATEQMISLPAATYVMGSAAFYPDERPVHSVDVAAFQIDRAPVTNAQFANFVDATGYVTVAERAPDAADLPGANPADLVPGALVFAATAGPVDLGDWRQWWGWAPGASWRHPFGPESSIDDKADHPVVQVAFADAEAYAVWADKRLPTEAEWEYAARGGLAERTYSWGNEPQDPLNLRANSWQGSFPYRNTGANGWVGTSPIGSFPANGFGLVDMCGNVWEWTADFYTTSHGAQARSNLATSTTDSTSTSSCACSPDTSGASGESAASAIIAATSAEPGSRIRRRVLKGGSHLCAPEYCLRYRPAARSPQAEDTSTTHIGFRCAR